MTLVQFDAANRRIDFQVGCGANRLTCPTCGAPDQGIHDRAAKSWRHLDFVRYETWLHADLLRVKGTTCAKISLLDVPLACPGGGFTLLFKALALSLCQELPVSQAADLLRVAAKQLWQCIAHDIGEARVKDDMNDVRLIGIDETSVKRGQHHITVVLRNLLWSMRKNPANWNQKQRNAMHRLQRSILQSARAWRLKMALRAVYASAVASNEAHLGES